KPLILYFEPLLRALDWAASYPALLGYTVGVLLLGFIAWRKQRAAVASGRPETFSDWLSAPFARPSVLAALLLARVCCQLGANLHAAYSGVPTTGPEALLAQLKANQRPGEGGTATSIDAGGYAQLEKVLHYHWPRAFHSLPHGTTNTFYRGNDE